MDGQREAFAVERRLVYAAERRLILRNACERQSQGRPQVELKNQMTDPCLMGQCEVCSHCERKNVPIEPTGDTWLQVQPGFPMQCWVGACGVALTEMVVYFAAGSLPPERPRSLPVNIVKEGTAWPRTNHEGTFISLGADPGIP